MPDINPSIPVIGQPDSTEEPKVVTALTQLVAAVNDVDSAQITDGVVTYADLNSTVDQYYKDALTGQAALVGGVAAATWVMTAIGPSAAAVQCNMAYMKYLDPAAFPSGSRSAKLRMTASLVTNATAPAMTITAGLYPIASSLGGVNVVAFGLGTVVPGSTVAFASPGANSQSHGETADFAFPSAGHYVLGFVTSGAMPANACLTLASALQFRAV
jgi:hypothetical protein